MGRGSSGMRSQNAMAKRLGFSVSRYRGKIRLTRGGRYSVFKSNDDLDSFLGKTFNREVYLGKPKKPLSRQA